MGRRLANVTGQKFERLTVIETTKGDDGRARVKVRCDCGAEKVLSRYDLVNGVAKSCGCLMRERRRRLGERTFVHGHAVALTKEYHSWQAMVYRCTNPNCHEWPNYGGRGIKIDDFRWFDFRNFLADMGPRPTPRHTIERRDNDKGYSKDNCYWATDIEQNNNRRNNVLVSYRGEPMTLMQAVRRAGSIAKGNVAGMRVQVYGWTVERAVETPPYGRRRAA